MGLNHMNGRVQDAVTGVFLSPDPVIGKPYFTPEYNRYSYVDNNPVTMVDPSGFDGCVSADDRVIPCANGDSQNGDSPAEITAPGDPNAGWECSLMTCPDLLSPGGRYPQLDPNPAPVTISPGQSPGGQGSAGGGNPNKSTQPTPAPSPKLPIPAPALLPVPVPHPKRPDPLNIPLPCIASRANNSQRLNNIKLGAAGGGLITGVVAANLFGFPEVEAIEGVGGLLGAVSALGDSGLIAFSYAPYGAIAGGVTGNLLTPGLCP